MAWRDLVGPGLSDGVNLMLLLLFALSVGGLVFLAACGL